MKISETSEVGAVSSVEKVAARPVTPLEKQDRVSTTQTEEVNRAIEVARQVAGSSRSAHLQQIENQIRSGAFKPNPSQIAERILESAEIDARLQSALRR